VLGLFVAVYSAVGFSIYFALGVVADRGLGLTPLIFLAAGLLFVISTLSYGEAARCCGSAAGLRASPAIRC
jgi:APA family basic amino acid/polyamine antiporter